MGSANKNSRNFIYCSKNQSSNNFIGNMWIFSDNSTDELTKWWITCIVLELFSVDKLNFIFWINTFLGEFQWENDKSDTNSCSHVYNEKKNLWNKIIYLGLHEVIYFTYILNFKLKANDCESTSTSILIIQEFHCSLINPLHSKV